MQRTFELMNHYYVRKSQTRVANKTITTTKGFGAVTGCDRRLELPYRVDVAGRQFNS